MRKKNNILLVELNRDIGGSVFSTITLASYMKKEGVNVYVATPKRCKWNSLVIKEDIRYIDLFAWPTVKKISDKNSIKKRCIKVVKDILNLLAELKLINFIIRNNIGIVHISTVNYTVGYWAAKLSKSKLVWHIREFLEEDHGTEWINKKVVIRQINYADAIICISKAIYSKYVNIFSDEKLYLVYNGIDNEKFFCDRNICISDNIVIGIFGRITEGKGQLELVEAISKLENLSNVQVYIYGEGDKEYTNIIERKISENNLEKKIHLMGFTDQTAEKLRQMDIICVCSRNEAFGRITVEAMMMGALVIGSDAAGTAEIIRECAGLLYRQGNVKELSDKIQWVIDNKKEAAYLARIGQRYANQKYSAEQNANQIMGIYKRIM